jgi:hypothetical protein
VRFQSGSSEFGRWRDVGREAAEADLRTLAKRTFPVYGLSAPLLDAPALSGWERENGRLVKVGLCHGDPFPPDGPFVCVTTLVADASPSWYEAEELAEAIEDERDRLFDQAGIDEEQAGAPVWPVTESEVWSSVDGVPLPVRLRREGPLWAARLDVGGSGTPALHPGSEPVRVTLAGRGVPADALAVRTVDDLAPYAYGRVRLLHRLAEHHGPYVPPQERRDLPEARGLESHRELVASAVRQALDLEARLRQHRRPRTSREDRADRGARWEITVRQQMRLAAESRDEADASVTSLVNHMVRLAERTDWFPDSVDGRDAVEESIRHTVFGSDVASLPAQRAWLKVWGVRPGIGRQRGPEDPAFVGRAAEGEWLRAWQRWRAARR